MCLLRSNQLGRPGHVIHVTKSTRVLFFSSVPSSELRYGVKQGTGTLLGQAECPGVP